MHWKHKWVTNNNQFIYYHNRRVGQHHKNMTWHVLATTFENWRPFGWEMKNLKQPKRSPTAFSSSTLVPRSNASETGPTCLKKKKKKVHVLSSLTCEKPVQAFPFNGRQVTYPVGSNCLWPVDQCVWSWSCGVTVWAAEAEQQKGQWEESTLLPHRWQKSLNEPVNQLICWLENSRQLHINKKRKKNQQNKKVWVTIPWFIVGSKDNCTELKFKDQETQAKGTVANSCLLTLNLLVFSDGWKDSSY